MTRQTTHAAKARAPVHAEREMACGCYCRWPRRDLLTCAPIVPGAPDVAVCVVSDFDWHGPLDSRAARERAAPYGPVLHETAARELHNWTARHAGFNAVVLADDAADEPGEAE